MAEKVTDRGAQENALVKFVWEAMSTEPPEWAKDPFNPGIVGKCGECGAWLTIVRPGKDQCDICPYLEHAAALKESEGE